MPNDTFKIEDKHEGRFTSSKLRWSVPLHRMATLSSSVAWMTCSFLPIITHWGGVKGRWPTGDKQETLRDLLQCSGIQVSQCSRAVETQGSVTWWWGQPENGLPEVRNHLEWIERCLPLGLSFCKAVFASPLANTGCNESRMAPFC